MEPHLGQGRPYAGGWGEAGPTHLFRVFRCRRVDGRLTPWVVRWSIQRPARVSHVSQSMRRWKFGPRSWGTDPWIWLLPDTTTYTSVTIISSFYASTRRGYGQFFGAVLQCVGAWVVLTSPDPGQAEWVHPTAYDIVWIQQDGHCVNGFLVLVNVSHSFRLFLHDSCLRDNMFENHPICHVIELM